MAFQTGTTVRPELGQLDYSGFERAAAIRAQALSNLGNQVMGAAEKYMAKKEQKAQEEMRLNAIQPYINAVVQDPEDAQALGKQFSKDPKLGAAILELAGKQKNEQAFKTAIAANTTPEGNLITDTLISDYTQLGGGVDDLGIVSSFVKQANRGKPTRIPGTDYVEVDGVKLPITNEISKKQDREAFETEQKIRETRLQMMQEELDQEKENDPSRFEKAEAEFIQLVESGILSKSDKNTYILAKMGVSPDKFVKFNLPETGKKDSLNLFGE